MAVSSMCQPGLAGCSEEPQGHEQRRCRLIPQHTPTTAMSRALAAVWLCAVQPGVCVIDTLRKKQNKSIATVSSTRFPADLKRLCVVAYMSPPRIPISGVLSVSLWVSHVALILWGLILMA